MRFSLKSCVFAAIAAIAAPLGAQQTPILTGRVIEADGTAIPDALIEVEGLPLQARSGETGAFSFSTLKTGQHQLTVRHVGFLPATRLVTVGKTPANIEVTLVKSTPMLDTVLVKAKVKILAGVVADSAGHPISGAKIEMVGATHGTTTSGADGWFSFTDLRTGPLVLRAMKPGWAMGMASLRFEDSRGIVIHLDAIDTLKLSPDKALQLSGLGNSDATAWAETQMRLVARAGRATVVPRQELEAFDDMTLGEAIRNAPSGQLVAMDLQATFNQACVLIDGRRMVGQTSLDTFHTDEVEFVELYPPGTEMSGTVARYMRSAGCRPVQTTGTRRGILYAVVWSR